ncbi:hypothetical protein KW787_03845 [Candidatus Pacearchaeota archaeon]|nr:hypothetical protein [Candidatus Pacearchaeota archaeon]
MKKEVVLIIGLLVVMTLILFKPHITGNVVLNPSVPQDCSLATIQGIWDTIFKESSAGITTFNGTIVNGKCSDYLAYKIVGEKAYVLFGLESSDGSRSIYNIYANASSNYTNLLKNITSISNKTLLYLTDLDNNTKKRSSSFTSNDADTEFKSIFKQTPTSWQANITSFSAFVFRDNESSPSKQRSASGSVDANYSYSYLAINEIPVACSPSWIEVNSSCRVNETLVVWYNDTNSCGSLTGKPVNITRDCDYNNDSFIGNSSSINSNVNLDFYVNGVPYTFSALPQATRLIDLRDNGIPRVIWNHTFTAPLNLRLVTIKKQSSLTQGSLIVNGIDYQKTFIVDKLNSSSNSVCIKNRHLDNISEISQSCSASNEVKLPCPGISSSYSCLIYNSTFIVSGLTNSGVQEFLDQQPVSCTVNWTCSPWNDCISGTRVRVCIDRSNCGTNYSKPSESEACSSPICVPDYSTCTPWQPSLCPETGKQMRTCTATNCPGILVKNETLTCTYSATNTKIKLIITVLIGAAALVGGLIVYLISRREKEGDVLSY